MALPTYGTMAVDWEQRIDFDRLRRERLARVKDAARKVGDVGALLCFDMNNVRYITATHIGTWAQDKISRFTLLPQDDEPILWDFGSAAQASSDPLSLAGRALARRNLPVARRDVPRNGSCRRRGEKNQRRTGKARPAKRAARRRHHRTADSVCAAKGRNQYRRRPANDVRCARDQNAGRNHAAQPCRP